MYEMGRGLVLEVEEDFGVGGGGEFGVRGGEV